MSPHWLGAVLLIQPATSSRLRKRWQVSALQNPKRRRRFGLPALSKERPLYTILL